MTMNAIPEPGRMTTTLEDGFQRLRAMFRGTPADFTEAEWENLRWTYYSGAKCLIAAMAKCSSAGAVGELMQDVDAELTEVWEELRQRSRPQ
jgi:hypothetical protein